MTSTPRRHQGHRCISTPCLCHASQLPAPTHASEACQRVPHLRKRRSDAVLPLLSPAVSNDAASEPGRLHERHITNAGLPWVW